jgi:hypothetical protein
MGMHTKGPSGRFSRTVFLNQLFVTKWKEGTNYNVLKLSIRWRVK